MSGDKKLWLGDRVFNEVEMKKLRYPNFALCVLLFASNSYAEEIVMICKPWSLERGQETRYYKYSNPFFGEKEILQRIDGAWKNWGSANPNAIKTELSISDKGAVMTQSFKEIADKEVARALGILNETPFIAKHKYFLDFEQYSNLYK